MPPREVALTEWEPVVSDDLSLIPGMGSPAGHSFLKMAFSHKA